MVVFSDSELFKSLVLDGKESSLNLSFSMELDNSELILGSQKLRSQALELGVPFVLVGADFSLEEISESSGLHQDFSILDLNQSPQNLKISLQVILEDLNRKKEEQNLRSSLIRENDLLQGQVYKKNRELQEQETKRQEKSQALRKASTILRKRIFFLKSLNRAMELSEVVSMVQDEVRKTKGLGGAVLAIPQNGEVRVLYLSGRLVLEKRIKPLPGNQNGDWRQVLANLLNRPIAPLLEFEGAKNRFLLFIEHQVPKSKLRDFILEWKLRMVGLELVLDRFQLEKDLSEAALFWEKTFDGLDEPIGIFDSEQNVVRANQLFDKELLLKVNEEIIRRGSQVFNVESYPIQMARGVAEGSKVVHLSDQSSSYQLKQHIIQTEKIAALGQLAGHIAHELNNPLTGIRSLCQVLLAEESLSESFREDVSEVENAAHRCQKTIKNLLDYSKPHTEDRHVPTDVNEVIGNTLPLLKSLIGKFKHEVNLGEALPKTLADPHMLQQVIFNLVANACQSMESNKKGKVMVSSFFENDQIQIWIQDEGPGVPKKYQQKIFEPFFTTKGEGQGTGLGLSLSLNVIRSFGGNLTLDENYEEGARFVIEMPKWESGD